MNRIALIGRMGSGKTTLANVFVNYNYNKISFGDKVKSVCSDLFKMPVEYKNRQLIQDVAEKMKEIDNNVWINFVIGTINQIDPYCEMKWIIDDCRFPNEYQKLKEIGFQFIYIKIDKNTQTQNIINKYGNKYLEHINNMDHISEKHIDTLGYTDNNMIVEHFTDIKSANEFVDSLLCI